MKNIYRRILETSDSWSALALRLALGMVILPHGMQKTLGMFGGFGYTGTMGFFTEQMGIPWIFALAAILSESIGGLALLLGAGTRIASAGIGITMLVAALTSHVQYGFFMNWFGNQKGEGVEFFILAFGMATALVIQGGGKLSVDRMFVTYKEGE